MHIKEVELAGIYLVEKRLDFEKERFDVGVRERKKDRDERLNERNLDREEIYRDRCGDL